MIRKIKLWYWKHFNPKRYEAERTKDALLRLSIVAKRSNRTLTRQQEDPKP